MMRGEGNSVRERGWVAFVDTYCMKNGNEKDLQSGLLIW
jgi:hypothetical protein